MRRTSELVQETKFFRKNLVSALTTMMHILTWIFICLLTVTHAGLHAAEISITTVGDITIGKDLIPTIDEKGIDELFAGTTEFFKDADITVGTLESSISSRGEAMMGIKNPVRAVPDTARGLANAGFKVLSLATPHIMDYGKEALEETIELLSWYAVKSVGAGKNLDAAKKPVTLTLKNTKISFLAYYQVNQFAKNLADADSPGAIPAIHSIMKKDIAKVKKESDIVVVFIHWGMRVYGDELTEKQQFWAHSIIDFGADLVLGQRLHALQGIEIYNNKAIVYSLADFIFGLKDKQHSKIVIPKFYFQDGKLNRIELTPIWVDNPEAKYQPQLLRGKEARKTLEKYQKRCANYHTTMDIKGEKGWIEIR